VSQTIVKPLCIIPARGNSKRLPRKNVKLLNGKPLLAYAIEAALKSKVFDLVCVSSEDEAILRIARNYGAQYLHHRPQELSQDKVQIRSVCASLLEHFSAEGRSYGAFGLLLPTNPLRTAADIQGAYKIFKSEKADVVMSVVQFSHPPQRAVCIRNGQLKPFLGLKFMKPAQELEPLYRHDGSVILAKADKFLKTRQFYAGRVVPYVVDPDRSVDIDTAFDFKWAQFLIKQ